MGLRVMMREGRQTVQWGIASQGHLLKVEKNHRSGNHPP